MDMQSGETFGLPDMHVPAEAEHCDTAEAEQGDTLANCSSSCTVKKCPFFLSV